MPLTPCAVGYGDVCRRNAIGDCCEIDSNCGSKVRSEGVIELFWGAADVQHDIGAQS
jgi:hypothetical protein